MKKNNSSVKLIDSTLEQYTEVLIKGNGFGHDSAWVKQFFKDEKFSIFDETPGQYLNNISQYVLVDYFKSIGFSIEVESYYDDSGEVAVTFDNLEIDPDNFVKIYKNAMLVLRHNKTKDIICLTINNYGPREISYRMCSDQKYSNVMKDWFAYARKNSFYKGKKIDADLRFLKIKNVSWSDIILTPKTINVVKNNINELFDIKDLLALNDIPLKSGIILSGPPGTGKTVLCKILANELNATVLYAMPDSMGRTADIKSVCEMAKELAPCVMIVEDIDYIAEDREYNRNSGGVMELMNYLDGIQEFADVITLATTNAVDKLEDAVKNRPGRFDRVISIPKPDRDCRNRMLKVFTSKYSIKDVDFEMIVKETDGLSGAHLKDICKTAARNAIRAKSYDENKIAILTQEHFEQALSEIKDVDYSTHFKNKVKSRMGFGSDF